MYFIGDIAGQYSALTRLIQSLPTREDIVLLGDLVDRGPDSKKVIELAMSEEQIITIKGNHEEMLLNAYDNDEDPIYVMDSLRNGGYETIKSYGADNFLEFRKLVPKSHIMFLRNLPLYWHQNGVLASHAPSLLEPYELSELETNPSMAWQFIWNRTYPKEISGTFQVFGHNSYWGLKWFGGPNAPWAVCIDTSKDKVLTALHWPSLRIYQVGYDE